MRKFIMSLVVLLGLVLAPQSVIAETRYDLCGGNYSYVDYDYSNWDVNSSMTVYYWIYNSSNQLVAYGWTRDPGAGKGRGKIQHCVNLYGAQLDKCVDEFRRQVDGYVLSDARINEPFMKDDSMEKFKDVIPYRKFNK